MLGFHQNNTENKKRFHTKNTLKDKKKAFPLRAVIAGGNRQALTEARAERREPLGVSERNGVSIERKTLLHMKRAETNRFLPFNCP